VSDFDAFDVGDGVIGAGCAIERDAEIAGPRLGLGEKDSGRKSYESNREPESSKSHHRMGCQGSAEV
jgi:hypothetical protein